MGRHAAPGEDEPEVAVQVTVPVVFADAVESLRPPGSRPQPKPRGRHAVADEDDDAEPSESLGVTDGVSTAVTDRLPQPASTGTAAERPPKESRARKEGATAADLRLLRTNPALRNRVIAAVLVPFVLFFLVLAMIGRLDVFAVWIWLPLISAGLGAGLLLDAGHARSKSAATEVDRS